MGEKTDAAALAKDLGRLLPLLARDAVAASIAAGTLAGPEGVALSRPLRRIAADEVRDLERVAARVASLGGTASATIPDVKLSPPWRKGLEALIRTQRETLDATVAAIPADADDVEGEATEHLLEHIVDRKRSAIELLERALR